MEIISDERLIELSERRWGIAGHSSSTEEAQLAKELLESRKRISELEVKINEVPFLDMRVLNNYWHGLQHKPENTNHFNKCRICSHVYEVEVFLKKYYIISPKENS